MIQIRTSFMFQAFLVCQLVWLSSSSFVNHKPSGDTDHVLETQQPIGSKKYKRDADSDIDYDEYDDDVLENPMFESLFGTLDSAEAEDLPPPPSKLELHLNVYVDKLWSGHFGSKSGPNIVRNIVEQTALILNHETLNTKIKLIYDEANLYTSTEHLLPRNSHSFYHETLLKQLDGPNLTTRGEPTAHLYLTVEGDEEKSFINGKSMINSMCGFVKPRVIVVHREEEIRTAMTVAHELGHLLGLEHDFVLGKRSKTCGGTKQKGPFVMNYGDTRQSFSECSNIDFKTYYHTVVAEKGKFCLTEGVVGCHCNGVENPFEQFGKCTVVPSGTFCHVNKDSGCKDLQPYHGQFLSSSPCKFKKELKETTTIPTSTTPSRQLKKLILALEGVSSSPQTTTPTTPTTPTTAPATETLCGPGESLKYAECPRYWRRFQESCYYFGTLATYLTWDEAASECKIEHINSTLPSVHSAEEGKFLQDNISSDQFWVGASRNVGADYTSPSSWTWSDGTAMKYTAWALGQPNNGHILYGERCVRSVERAGEIKWDDHRCWKGITRAFVCKLQLQWSIRRDGELFVCT